MCVCSPVSSINMIKFGKICMHLYYLAFNQCQLTLPNKNLFFFNEVGIKGTGCWPGPKLISHVLKFNILRLRGIAAETVHLLLKITILFCLYKGSITSKWSTDIEIRGKSPNIFELINLNLKVYSSIYQTYVRVLPWF